MKRLLWRAWYAMWWLIGNGTVALAIILFIILAIWFAYDLGRAWAAVS